MTLDQLDGRTAAYREAHQLVANLLADLGDDLTVDDQELANRAAMLGAIARDFETRWTAGEKIRIADYLAAAKLQRLTLASLNKHRQKKSRAGPLGRILAAGHAAAAREREETIL